MNAMQIVGLALVGSGLVVGSLWAAYAKVADDKYLVKLSKNVGA